VDEQLKVLVWNSHAADLWGLQAAEVEGRSIHGLDIGLPVERLRLQDFVAVAKKQGPQKVVLDARTRRGQPIRCEVSITPFLVGDGQCRGAVLLMEDVTDHAEMVTALLDSSERFRVVLLHSPIAVSMQDRILRYTWAYDPILGQSVDAMIGRSDVELFSSEDATKLTEIKQRVLASGTGVQEEIELSVDGSPRHYNLTVEPLRNAEGALIGVTCAAMEIIRRPDTKKMP
jgi:PAS domain S-box-containing protein